VFGGLILISVLFFAVHVLPGDPARLLLGDTASVEAVKQVRRQFGLDRPLVTQYLLFMTGLGRGDLGISFASRESVSVLLFRALPNSIALLVLASTISLVLGLAVGFYLGVSERTRATNLVGAVTMVWYAVPAFCWGIILLYVFAFVFAIVPVIPRSGTFSSQLFLAGLALGLPYSVYVSQAAEASIRNTLRSDFIRTAYAKGVSRFRVLQRHVMMHALIPVATVIGLNAGIIIGGTVIIESVFHLHGLGEVVLAGTLERDYPVLLGAVITYVIVVLGANLCVDLAYTFLDPRIRYG